MYTSYSSSICFIEHFDIGSFWVPNKVYLRKVNIVYIKKTYSDEFYSGWFLFDSKTLSLVYNGCILLWLGFGYALLCAHPLID